MVRCRTFRQRDTILHDLSHHYFFAKFTCAWDCTIVILFRSITFPNSTMMFTLVNTWGLHTTFLPSDCHAGGQVWFPRSTRFSWDQFKFVGLSFEFDSSHVCSSSKSYLTHSSWINPCFSDPTYSYTCLFGRKKNWFWHSCGLTIDLSQLGLALIVLSFCTGFVSVAV